MTSDIAAPDVLMVPILITPEITSHPTISA